MRTKTQQSVMAAIALIAPAIFSLRLAAQEVSTDQRMYSIQAALDRDLRTLEAAEAGLTLLLPQGFRTTEGGFIKIDDYGKMAADQRPSGTFEYRSVRRSDLTDLFAKRNVDSGETARFLRDADAASKQGVEDLRRRINDLKGQIGALQNGIPGAGRAAETPPSNHLRHEWASTLSPKSPTIRPDAGTPSTVLMRDEVLLSDSFNHPYAEGAAPEVADLAFGGHRKFHYLPLWQTGGIDTGRSFGSILVHGALQNNGLDFGGVQFSDGGDRGTDIGQNVCMKMDLFVPTNEAGQITCAGPYFRSRQAAGGDGLLGSEECAGYWVQLYSTGVIKVHDLRWMETIATSTPSGAFDSGVFHTLEIAAHGEVLDVTLDGQPVSFQQGGRVVTAVSIPPTGGLNSGTAGIAFGAPDNRGQIGGQRADNLVVSGKSSVEIGMPGELPPSE